MEYRQLGNSGLMVSAMSPGTMTFGGKSKFAEVGSVGVDEAREAEYELLPIEVDQKLGALIWSPLGGGLLSGKYNRDNFRNVEGRFANGWDEPPVEDFDRLWNIVDVLDEIASQKGISVAQLSLAWTLSRPGVSSIVAGARNATQLQDTLKAVDITLTAEESERLNAVSRPQLLYPYWHQARFICSRMGIADHVLLDSY